MARYSTPIVLSFRLIAEERKTGTVELLLTLPVRDGEVVLGKFLAGLGMVGAGLLCTLPYALSVSFLAAGAGAFDWGSTFAGYLGLFSLAGSFLALCGGIGFCACIFAKPSVARHEPRDAGHRS